jgi:GTP-binding protein Era
MTFLSGFVAIAGPPNVGKSTLLNRLLGTKVAIVSPKPQTTRNRILGIYHGEGCQIVFMDTPGIHRTRTALHESMVASAQAALQEVDIIAVMIEMPHPEDREVPRILGNLKKVKKPCLLVINKIDLGPKKAVLPIIETYRGRHPFEAFLPVSALQGDGLEALLDELKSLLKPGPRFFPRDMKTDQSESFLISEVIREKIYLHMRGELPYACAVTVDTVEEDPAKNLLSIAAKIHVETESQKGMVIGGGGKMIKAIGRSARLDIEGVFGTRVFLDLTVRVEKKWSKNPRAMRRLGY